MSAISKREFVLDMMNQFPDTPREAVINKLLRAPHTYRGARFTHKTASTYYWWALSRGEAEGIGATSTLIIKVPRGQKRPVMKYLKALFDSGLILAER